MLHIHTKYEVSITIYMDMRANQRKISKWLPFKTLSQNQLKCNDHILDSYVHIHVKNEVSVTNYMDRRANKGNVPKWLPVEN